MKKVLSLLPILLALGSCQSDNSPTQTDPSADQIGVAARLVSTKALPQAQFFRARLTVGGGVGDWVDAAYTRGAELVLGKVKRGTIVVLDVRGYSVDGSDTLWKWFARKSDSATGSVLTIEAEIKGVEVSAPTVGQVLKVPVGSWYTTDTTSWANKASVDSTGAIPALSGTVLLVRLRMAVPGTSDTLLGDVLRYVLPRKPTLLPPNRALKVSDSVIITGASGDSLVFCEGAGCSSWAPYTKAFLPKAFVLRARALRNGLASPVEEASFTLAPSDTTSVQPADTVVGSPYISPNPGALAPNDFVRITPDKAGDSLRYSIDGGTTWSGYSGPIKAGAFTLAVVSLRGKYHSDTVRGAYTLNTSKPSSPTIKSNCDVAGDCDPGMTVELSTTDTGVTLQYALLADSSNWKPYAKFPLTTSTKVFARALRGSETSAVQTATYVVVQPDTVRFAVARETWDTTWVKLSTTSGTIWFSRGASRDSSKWTSSDSLPVRASDSLFAWTWRGTARSFAKAYRAQVATPGSVGKPSISPNSGAVASTDFISITPARPGDSIRYTTNGTDWLPYSDPFKAGAFTVRAVAFREGRNSDTASATYTLSSTKPSSPNFAYTCAEDVCDPGVSIGLSTTDTGVTLLYALGPDSAKWIEGNKVVLTTTTKVFARAARNTDTSATRSITITVAQPDTVVFVQARRNPDTIWVKLSTTSGSIRFSRGALGDSANYTDTIPVRVNDSLTAWAWRGTAKSGAKTFKASAVKPDPPRITSPLDSVIFRTDSIEIESASGGDTLQVKVGSVWSPYTGRIGPGQGGPFTVTVRSKRNGLASDSVSKTYFVDTATLAPPGITPGVSGNPGAEFAISATVGSNLEWTNDTTKTWTAAESPLKFSAGRDTTIFARAKAGRKISSVQIFAIRIQQPGAVRFNEASRGLDTVALEIIPVAGDTVVYSRNGATASTKAATSGTVTITVRANDSITAWAKRGDAQGSASGYRMVPAAPGAPIVRPNGGDVRDTTNIQLDPAATGDSVSYKIGSVGDWTPYTRSILLPPGDVDLYARATRNGVSKDTLLGFAVHAIPRKPGVIGCRNGCDPGSALTVSVPRGHDVYVKVGTGTHVKRYNLYSETITANNTTVCAYADSLGYRSADTCVNVTITPPVAPTISAVRVVRAAGFDSAYVTVEATQIGDQLMARFGTRNLASVSVASTTSTTTYGIERTNDDSVLTVWTKRGTDSSTEAEYILSKLPPPKPDFVSGGYLVGKTFTFARDLDLGALATDTVYVSKDQGASWIKSTDLKLTASADVWAKTTRRGFGGTTDSSAISTMTYTLDSSIVDTITLVFDDGSSPVKKAAFDVTTWGDHHGWSVPDHAPSLGVEFAAGASLDDISKYEVRCDNCVNTGFVAITSASPSVVLQQIGANLLTFRVTTTWNLVRTYRITVHRTAPWNASVTYGEVSDSRDGQIYKTVSIGGKTWMAENLRYLNTANGTGETCYGNDTLNCREYGRLYTWAEASNANRICDTIDCSINPLPNDGICPFGYRLPEFDDWKSLAVAAGTTDLVNLSSQTAPGKLRAASREWNSANWFDGTDEFGFRALPAGSFRYDTAPGAFERLGVDALWWMANQSDTYPATMASAYQLYGESLPQGSFSDRAGRKKLSKLSVRCVEK